MRRILLYVIVIPLVLLIVAALLIPLLVDKKQLLDLASEALEKKTGATLAINGSSSFTLLPRIALEMKDAELTLPGPGQPDLSARSLEVGVKLLPLFSGSVEIKSLGLDGLLINIPPAAKEARANTSQLSDAQLDAFYAKRREALTQAGAQRVDAGAALALPLALEVNEFSLTKSRIVLLAEGNEAETIVDIHSLEADNLNLAGQSFPLKLSLSLPASEGSTAVDMTLATTLTANLEQNLLSISGLSANISGATADPVDLKADGKFDLQRITADISLALDSGDINGKGKLRFASYESPQIDTELHFNQFDPAIFALTDRGATREASSSTAAKSNELPVSTLRNMDTRAKLTIDKAVYDNYQLSNIIMQLRVADGVATLAPVTAEVYGGKLSLKATLNAKHNTVRVNTNGELTDVQLPQLLKASESKVGITGQASANWQLAGEGENSDKLRSSLHGPVKIRTKSVVLEDLGIERMLCQAVALVNREQLSADLPQQSAFEALTIDIDVADGKARLNPLTAKLDHLSLSGEGGLNLESLDFDTEFDAKLSTTIADLDPACRVNERLTAIKWPVVCKGNLQGDSGKWCKVDSGDIVKDLTKNEVKRKVNEEAGKLFNKVFGRDKKSTSEE